MLEVAEKVQEAYKIYTGELLPIEVNAGDKSSHDQSLYVESKKIRNKICVGESNKMTEEAIEIFKLLKSEK